VWDKDKQNRLFKEWTLSTSTREKSFCQLGASRCRPAVSWEAVSLGHPWQAGLWLSSECDLPSSATLWHTPIVVQDAGAIWPHLCQHAICH
jgi:hypothetical protein